MADFFEYVHLRYEQLYSMLHVIVFETRDRTLIQEVRPLIFGIRYVGNLLKKGQRSYGQMIQMGNQADSLNRDCARNSNHPFWAHRQVFGGLKHLFAHYAMERVQEADGILLEIEAGIQDFLEQHNLHLDAVPEGMRREWRDCPFQG